MRITTIVVAMLIGAGTVYAQDDAAHEKTEAAEAAKNAVALASAMKEAKVSLASGLRSAERNGRPISAKFEVEDGKLQLSVYTVKADRFFEVIVDHKSGKVAKTEPITGGDLANAKEQAEAMSKTKRSLRDVVSEAEKANAGYKAVSVTPETEDGIAEANVSLIKGTESKQVEEKL